MWFLGQYMEGGGIEWERRDKYGQAVITTQV
jgi:hypothetical protein